MGRGEDLTPDSQERLTLQQNRSKGYKGLGHGKGFLSTEIDYPGLESSRDQNGFANRVGLLGTGKI